MGLKEAKIGEKSPLEILKTETSEKARLQAARDLIKQMIKDSGCNYILEGFQKREDEYDNTICNL